MKVAILPALADNYMYVLTADTGGAVVVDPSEAAPVAAYLDAHRLALAALWCTHHHADHTAGIADLLARWPKARVVGSACDGEAGRIAGQTDRAADGERVQAAGIEARVLAVPGHTRGAIAYVVSDPAGEAVFTGDTLFLGGCGRLFEGTPAEMYASLMRLSALPPDTRIYCGHEYTRKNLAFALHVAPSDGAVRARLERLPPENRALPSVPGSIAEERATNPFLRAESVAAFAALRQQKDVF